jgi:hypothetical protein
MIALTSISPKHINEDIQGTAINSWVNLGLKVYSFNNSKEIAILKDNYKNVTFIESISGEHKFGRPLIYLDTLLDFAKTQDDTDICLINSDIILNDSWTLLPEIIEKLPHRATIVKRRDFINDINDNKVFESGIDVFFIHKNYIDLIPRSEFAIGACWWDYHVPYSLMKANIPVKFLREPFAFHRLHNVQYSAKEWEALGHEFKHLHSVRTRSIMQLNNIIYAYIMDNVK